MHLALLLVGFGTWQLGGALGAPDVVKRRGTGWGFDTFSELQALSELGWWYNWGTSSSDTNLRFSEQFGMEFVPMQWGPWGLDTLEQYLYPNATTLLGFNEPNHQQQANMLPADAAQLWPQLQAVAEKLGLRLGTPAAAPCGYQCINMNPFDWLDQFFGNCSGCKFDFLATHLYSCNPDYLQWYVDSMAARYGLPVWLTEFDCPNGQGPLTTQLGYMIMALIILDSHPYIERYAWFAPHTWGGWIGATGSLLQPSGTLALLGQLYLSFDLQPSQQLPANVTHQQPADTLESLSRQLGLAPEHMAVLAQRLGLVVEGEVDADVMELVHQSVGVIRKEVASLRQRQGVKVDWEAQCSPCWQHAEQLREAAQRMQAQGKSGEDLGGGSRQQQPVRDVMGRQLIDAAGETVVDLHAAGDNLNLLRKCQDCGFNFVQGRAHTRARGAGN